MVIENMIFSAVYSGNRSRLEVCFESVLFFSNLLFSIIMQKLMRGLSKQERKNLSSTKHNGITCLLIAARSGYYSVMDYLITECDADVEQV